MKIEEIAQKFELEGKIINRKNQEAAKRKKRDSYRTMPVQ